MSDARSKDGDNELARIALEKLGRVLGPSAGRRAYDEALAALRLETVRSAQDLYDIGQQISKREGMAAAVGGLICVAAVLRGATRR